MLDKLTFAMNQTDGFHRPQQREVAQGEPWRHAGIRYEGLTAQRVGATLGAGSEADDGTDACDRQAAALGRWQGWRFYGCEIDGCEVLEVDAPLEHGLDGGEIVTLGAWGELQLTEIGLECLEQAGIDAARGECTPQGNEAAQVVAVPGDRPARDVDGAGVDEGRVKLSDGDVVGGVVLLLGLFAADPLTQFFGVGLQTFIVIDGEVVIAASESDEPDAGLVLSEFGDALGHWAESVGSGVVTWFSGGSTTMLTPQPCPVTDEATRLCKLPDQDSNLEPSG